MAQRIAITVLGATLAPYSTGGPALVNGGISEVWHIDVSQLQRGVDTTATQRVTYSHALSQVVVKFVNANHFQTQAVYININSSDLDALANA